jgi:hypothetical protein
MRFEILKEDEALKIKTKSDTWYIDSADEDGDVEIWVMANNKSTSLYLSQDELKVLIQFLQKQIK